MARTASKLFERALLFARGTVTQLTMQLARQLWHHWAKEPWQGLCRSFEQKRYQSLWDGLLTSDAANSEIARLLDDRRPCLVGRIGHTEGRIVGECIFRFSRFSRISRKQAHQNAGIFPVDPCILTAFSEIYAESISRADLLGFWQTAYQVKLLSKCYSGIPLAPLASLEPYLHASPWSAALKHRRVLVVHPFAESIRRQFEQKRRKLFANQEVLPEMDLEVLAPPQTLAPLTSGYGNWIEALGALVEQVLQREFEVALLGCGAYGLPLGAAIKDAGRQAIHLGGALQVMFGIRGRRWEQIPVIAGLMNDYWIRPSMSETPKASSLVEGGCYW